MKSKEEEKKRKKVWFTTVVLSGNVSTQRELE